MNYLAIIKGDVNMRIGFCGYSYHDKTFQTTHKSRLSAYLFRLQVEGKAQVKIKNKYHMVQKGSLVIVKPHEEYELFVSDNEPSGDFNVYCEGEWINEKFSVAPSISTIYMEDSLLELWNQLIIEERKPNKEKNSELSYHLLSALLLSLERSLNRKGREVHRPYIVTKMMRYIEINAIKQDFQLSDVAEECNLSVSRCAHLFKEHVQQTIIDYAQSIRLTAAINQMKYTTMTLENIALNCGFSSYSYFHRVFKKHFHQSPREYRSKM